MRTKILDGVQGLVVVHGKVGATQKEALLRVEEKSSVALGKEKNHRPLSLRIAFRDRGSVRTNGLTTTLQGSPC